MADFYPYLIASLPMLHFGMKPPFSFERFLELCRPFTPEKDYQLIRILPQPEQYPETRETNLVIQRWIAFDTALRNDWSGFVPQKNISIPQHICDPEGMAALPLPLRCWERGYILLFSMRRRHWMKCAGRHWRSCQPAIILTWIS